MCFLSREREGMTINWEKGGLFLMNVHMQMDPSATPPLPAHSSSGLIYLDSCYLSEHIINQYSFRFSWATTPS